jgi:L-fuculose-phosphate aldolase
MIIDSHGHYTTAPPRGCGFSGRCRSPIWGSVNTRSLGETLAATLGQRPAVLLKAHGAVIVGSGIVECFALAAYLEENAYRQYMALQIGVPYVFSEAEQQACRERLWSPGLFQKAWDHYRAKLPPA